MKKEQVKMDKYVSIAYEHGADSVVETIPDKIVFDARTLLKCMYGCKDWGKGCTCPSRPGFPPLKDLKKMLKKYKKVLIIHAHDKKAAQNASLAVENEAYLDGDALVFSMSDCALCEECGGRSDQSCRNVMKARPAFHSVGIDVFATAKNHGLSLHPLRNEDDEQNWYAAVWLN